MPEYRVSKHDVGLSLTQFLTRKIPAAPTAYWRQLIKKGRVRNVLGPLSAGHLTILDEIIQLPESNRLSEFLTRAASLPDVLFESREILIVNKPSGLATHSSKGHEQNNLTDLIRLNYGQKFKISPVHRLDLETSGPVLCGKGKKSCSELGKLLMAGKMKKIYLALVQGRMTGEGTLSAPLPSKGKWKDAVSGYEVVSSTANLTLLWIELLTGRQHQIRRQLALCGHPIVGDRRYNGPCHNGLQRLFLHCSRLSFDNPFEDDRTIDICVPLPEPLVAFLRELGFEPPPSE